MQILKSRERSPVKSPTPNQNVCRILRVHDLLRRVTGTRGEPVALLRAEHILKIDHSRFRARRLLQAATDREQHDQEQRDRDRLCHWIAFFTAANFAAASRY